MFFTTLDIIIPQSEEFRQLFLQHFENLSKEWRHHLNWSKEFEKDFKNHNFVVFYDKEKLRLDAGVLPLFVSIGMDKKEAHELSNFLCYGGQLNYIYTRLTTFQNN